MKRTTYRLGLAAFCLLLAACQINPTPTPPPTAAPQFTATLPAPSVTPPPAPPTATLAPVATPTPAATATATADPNFGVGDVVYEDKMDFSSGWGWSFQDAAATFSMAGGQLNAVMQQPNVGPRFSMRDDLRVGDQQLRVTARTNLCYERDEYGLMFRFQLTTSQNYNGYIFKLNCGGQARVELLRDEQITVLVDWTPSPAIVPGAPAENQLMVWVAQDQFHFYANDQYLFSLKDATYAEGLYGFYIRDRTNGGESVSFDDLVAKAVKLP
jgi:hypothetical protein